MNLKLLPIDEIIPYPGNPRTTPQPAINKVASSIEKYGWRQPIVVDQKGTIIAGHVRLLAAKQLGYDHVEVEVADLTPELVRGYRLMDNRSHEDTTWNPELLKFEMKELDDLKFDLKFTGFQSREIDQLLSNEDLKDRPSSGPLSKPAARINELFRCGEHRVLCGDSTNPDHVRRVLDGTKPLLMSTDPPYSVAYEPEWREKAGLGTVRQVGSLLNDDRADWRAAYSLFPGDVAYVWHAGIHSEEVAAGLKSAGFEIRAQIIWCKTHFVLSRGMYHYQHEPCYVCVRKGQNSHWRGDRTQSTVWSVPNLNPFGSPDAEETLTGHATQKPIELMRRPILNHTERGDVVYDPFLGSGTNTIAAELTGRVCHGLELDPKYVDLIVSRWQQLTGRAATLDGDGRSFDEIRAERA